MGLDMYLYNSSEEKNENVDYLYDDSKTLYWRGNRDLHDLFVTYGNRDKEREVYHFNKTNMLKLLRHLMESITNVHKAVITAYYDIEDINQNEYEDSKTFREYYVVGRILHKSITKELIEGYSTNAINLFDDNNGNAIKNFIDNILNLLIEMKDDETLIYLPSY